MADIRMNLEMAKEIVHVAEAYRQANAVPRDELAVALVLAGFAILSAGMNEIQFQSVVRQASAFTADLRRRTEARWRKTGFAHETDVVMPCIHVLHEGHALCGLVSPPSSWPEGHRWVGIDNMRLATCDGCLGAYRKRFEGEGGN